MTKNNTGIITQITDAVVLDFIGPLSSTGSPTTFRRKYC